MKGIDLRWRTNIEKIAYDNNLDELNMLTNNVFSVLIEQKELIEIITTLSEETQHELM